MRAGRSGLRLIWAFVLAAVAASTFSSCGGDSRTSDSRSGDGGMGGSGGGDSSASADATGGGDSSTSADATGDSGISCSSDNDCQPLGLLCHPVLGECTACVLDADCDSLEHCNSGTCVPFTPCVNSLDCTQAGDDKTICDEILSECVECVTAEDCPENHDCTRSECSEYTPCTNSLDCPKETVCDRDRGRCVGCVVDSDCGVGERCVNQECRTSCASDNDCTGLGQLCDQRGGYCTECVSHEDCLEGAHCTTGECEVDLCLAGTAICDSNDVATCNAVGSGYTSVMPCPTGAGCVQTGTSASCAVDGGQPDGSAGGQDGGQTDGSPGPDASSGSQGSVHAVEFTGAQDSFIDVGDVDIPSDFTLEFWFKPAVTQPGNDQMILVKDVENVGQNQFRIGMRDRYAYFYMSDATGNDGGLWTGSYYRLRSLTTVPLGLWHHVAVTKDSAVIALYLDGVFQSAHTPTTALTHAGTTPLRFGGRAGVCECSFTGVVDEARLWNIARSGAEIATDRLHSISSGHVDYSSLVHYWRIDEGTGTSTADVRGIANGLLSSATWVSPGAPLLD